MPINYTNKNNIELFVNDNITLINEKITEFSKKKHPDLIFDQTDIRRYMKARFIEYVSDETRKQSLIDRFEAVEFANNRIPEIAVTVGLRYVDLKDFYQKTIFEELSQMNSETICNSVIDTILNHSAFTPQKKRYAKSQLKRIMSKSIYLTLKNGYTFNLNNAEEGIMTANAGDSAQFLFLARAILAGYNCSNVDVRSSRYDAVIDQNGRLFRVQVKGITQNTLQFKDRDRGGRGIDTEDEHNRGRRITSDDCDLYVAVDKQIGICYIIPTAKIEEWNVDSKPVSSVSEYKENWSIIDHLGEQ